jgi:lipopolysaccharide export LptBFGC system permease protein LptF
MLLVVTVLGALYVRTSRAGSRFPVTQSISSIAGGMVPVIIAAALGL